MSLGLFCFSHSWLEYFQSGWVYHRPDNTELYSPFQCIMIVACVIMRDAIQLDGVLSLVFIRPVEISLRQELAFSFGVKDKVQCHSTGVVTRVPALDLGNDRRFAMESLC